jgi:hypothetical protein
VDLEITLDDELLELGVLDLELAKALDLGGLELPG